MKWSYSGHRAMRTCQRQFSFAHIMASHNARDPERREAHILKQLQQLTAWQGSVVHRILATDFLRALQVGASVDWAALVQDVGAPPSQTAVNRADSDAR